MKIFSNLKNLFIKSSQATENTRLVNVLPSWQWNKPQWSQFNLKDYYEKGYSNPYVYRAINLIIEGITSLDIYPQELNGEDIKDENILQILSKPNPNQSFKDYIREVFLHYFLGGACFSIVVDIEDNKIEIYPLSANVMSVRSSERLGDPLTFIYKPQRTEFVFSSEQVYWFKNVHPLNPFSSFPPLRAAEKSIESNNYYLAYIKNLFANDGIPPSYVALENSILTDSQRKEISESFYSRMGNRLLTLEGGAKLSPLGWSPRDLSLQQINQMTIKDISVALGVSPILLGDSSQSTYSNYASARAQLYMEAVVPLAIRFYAGFSAWLSTKLKNNINIKIDLDSVDALNVVRESKWQSTMGGYEKGVITLNEAREALGYSPVEEGDTFKTPISIDFQGNEKNYKSLNTKAKRIAVRAPSRDRKRMRQLTAELTQKISNALEQSIREVVKPLLALDYKPMEKSSHKDFKTSQEYEERLVDKIIAKMKQTTLAKLPSDVRFALAEIMRDNIKINLALLKPSDVENIFAQLNPKVEAFANQHSAELVGMKWVNGELVDNPNPRWAITETTREQLKNTIAEAYQNNLSVDELGRQIADDYMFSKSRAEMIARTELARADSFGNIETWKECGVSYKQWLLGGEPCPDCVANADVGIIAIDEEFPSGDIPVHPNCECDVCAIIEKE